MVAREEAMRCLAYLVSNDDSLKLLVARQGVIESLKGYLDSSPVARSLEETMELVRNLALYQAAGEVLISEGFIGRLVLALSCGVLGVRTAAAGAVYGLSFSSKSRKELAECGCIGPLVKMLDGKAMEEREAAAMALSRLLLYAGNRKLFKKEERGVISTVLLLDHSMQNLDKKWPVSVLASMADSKKCRKQMVAAGVFLRLQKLVELDVDGAKKLSDRVLLGRP
ncbi:U-box domain-containing protein [Drosera capensis]